MNYLETAPSVVRRMVESLARDNAIDFIVCTSTLAEGVNLPAKNLFLQNPIQYIGIGEKTQKIEDVKLNNITGRAGRMLEHFAGNIFLVQPEKWKFKDYFDENNNKEEKISTYYQVLNDDHKGIIKILLGEYDRHQDKTYTYYAIANKLIQEFESEIISTTLSAKELRIDQRQKNSLLDAVKTARNSLQVPPFTLAANPTVGYLQQNQLYAFLNKQKRLSDWILPYPQSPKLYVQLEKVCSLLEELGIFLPRKSSIEFACVIAKKWIQGKPLRSMISEQISRNPEKKCNVNVRNVIGTINDDVRFKMASALRCYQLILSTIAKQKNVEITNVKLHGYIEVGGCGNRLIQLVGLGFSRETAIEIDSILNKDVQIDSFNTLRNLFKSGALNSMHPITRKETERLLI